MRIVKQRSRSAFIVVMSLTLLSLIGCQTNPYTGRSQLLMTSVSDEMKMGAQAYDQVKNDPKLQTVSRSSRDRAGEADCGPHCRSGQALEVCRDGESVSVGSDGHQG